MADEEDIRERTFLGQDTKGQDQDVNSSCNEVNCEMENSTNFKQKLVSLRSQTKTSSQRYQTSDDNVMQEIRPLISTSTSVAQFPCIQPTGVQNATGQETLPPPPYSRCTFQRKPFLYTTPASPAVVTQPARVKSPCDFLFLSVLSCLCCIWPIGIAAICFSCKSRSAKDKGNISSARKYGYYALGLSIFSIVGGIIIISFWLSSFYKTRGGLQ